MAEFKFGVWLLNMFGVTFSGLALYVQFSDEHIQFIKNVSVISLSGIYLIFLCYKVYQQGRKIKIENDSNEFDLECRKEGYENRQKRLNIKTKQNDSERHKSER